MTALVVLLLFLFAEAVASQQNLRHTNFVGTLSNGKPADENKRRLINFSDVSFPTIGSATVVDNSLVMYEMDVIDKKGSEIVFVLHDAQEAQELYASDGLVNFQIVGDTIGGPPKNHQPDSTKVPNFPCYRNLNATFQFMYEMTTRYPNLATVQNIGDSYLKTASNGADGHDILVLKLTSDNGVQNKAHFFAMFGIHAREMAPPELGMKFAETLVQGYDNDADITTLLDYTEVHLLLQTNPDARFVAENKQDLLRRKNMRPAAFGETCSEGRFGVDLNRNFPFQWGNDQGSSNKPCSSTFRGTGPASEPEIKAVVDYVSGLFPESQRKADPQGANLNDAFAYTNTGMFFDVHSYGEINIYPWSFKQEISANDDQLKALAIKFRYFNGYALAGPGDEEFLYLVSGGSTDWAFGELGVAASTLELGSAFYQECTEFEEKIVPSNLAVLLYGARVARAPFIESVGPDVVQISLSSTAIPNSPSAFLSITVEASDSAYSDPAWTTAQNGVQLIVLFVDDYPFGDTPQSNRIVMDMNTPGRGTLNMTGADLLTKLNSPRVGRHTLYAQAIDNSNNGGPVSSLFLQVCDPDDTACLADYNSAPCDPSTVNNTLEIASLGGVQTIPCSDLLIESNKYLCENSNAKVVCECSCLD